MKSSSSTQQRHEHKECIMEEERDKKKGKPPLIFISIALLAFVNSVVMGRTNVEKLSTAFQTSFELANTAAVVVLDPSAYVNLTMDNNDTCVTQLSGPLARGHYATSAGTDYTSGLNISENSSEAICLYDRTQFHHFPHAMQQLFGCFSFWNVHSTKQPVLAVDTKSLNKKLLPQRVTRNFLEMLQSQISLQILVVNLTWAEAQQNSTTEKPYTTRNMGFDGTYYKELHKHTAAHFRLKDTSSDTCTHPKPRIGILNRANHSFRSILNAEQIATAAKELSRDNRIPVVYFEDLDFVDQVGFFRSVDILISPHGAQLTGLAYMNAPCAHVLEVFPKHYAIPFYFGTLAMTSGKRYSYLYMSEGSFLVEQAMDKYERKSVRNSNVCPSIRSMMEYVQELVADWNKCCLSTLSTPT